MHVDICLPAYNEEKILRKNCLRLFEYCRQQHVDFSWNIVVLVNGSTDNSAAIAKELSTQYSEIKTEISITPGRGRALRAYWLKSPADIVSYMDADLSVELDGLSNLLAPLLSDAADLAFGSRLREGAEVKRSLGREIISRTYNWLAHAIVPHPYRDLQCGFKAVRREAFAALSPLITSNGWFFDTELIIWADRRGYRLSEVPVNWQQARFGPRPSTVRLFGDTVMFLKELFGLRKKLKHWR